MRALVVIGFILGLCVGLLICVQILSELREENERLRERLTESRRKAKGERSRRLDTEIALEDAGETIAYQRDELYRVKHPAELMEYGEE